MKYDLVHPYIETLYSTRAENSRSEFIEKTQLKEFTPVVDQDVARLLQVIVRLTRPARILEIGTSIGYSAVSMALMVQPYGGKITTIEFDEKVASQARQNFRRAGVTDTIDLHLGDAREILPALTPGYDMVFQDTDKRIYPLLLDDCLRLLKPGGLLVAEDTLFPVLELDERWQYLVPPIQQFNEFVAASRRLVSTLLPVGDGVTLAVKNG